MAYAPIKVPEPLLELVDDFIGSSPMGFRSRTEFVTSAVRDYLGRMDEQVTRIQAMDDESMGRLRRHVED